MVVLCERDRQSLRLNSVQSSTLRNTEKHWQVGEIHKDFIFTLYSEYSNFIISASRNTAALVSAKSLICHL